MPPPSDRRPSKSSTIVLVRRVAFAVAVFLPTFLSAFARADTLDDVIERGSVRCGVNLGLPGFARANSLGAYSGFDIDFCRAVAAAVLGDDRAVETVPVSAADRFAALANKEFDLLSRNTTWTLTRNALNGEFVGTYFLDGQTFMVPTGSGLRTALQLDGRRICVPAGTSLERNAEQYFRVNELAFDAIPFADLPAAFAGYLDGKCDAVTGDLTALASRRSDVEQPAGHAFLPESISKEPLGPIVRSDDTRWENIVRWSLFCLINAEESGIDSGNASERIHDATPDVLVLLGIEGSTGEALGLRKDWCASIVSRVGNYAELYERHLGMQTPMGIERGVNALWTNGGILFAPPIR